MFDAVLKRIDSVVLLSFSLTPGDGVIRSYSKPLVGFDLLIEAFLMAPGF